MLYTLDSLTWAEVRIGAEPGNPLQRTEILERDCCWSVVRVQPVHRIRQSSLARTSLHEHLRTGTHPGSMSICEALSAEHQQSTGMQDVLRGGGRLPENRVRRARDIKDQTYICQG